MITIQKSKISKNVSDVMDFLRIIIGIFLFLVVLIWITQIFHLEDSIPYHSFIDAFLTKFNSFFMTIDPREENNNTVMFLSINMLILLIIFSMVGDIAKDMMKMYERSCEEAIEEDNIRINEQIKRNYVHHLRHTMQFVLMLRLKFPKTNDDKLAFSDQNYSQKREETRLHLLKEIKMIISSSIQSEKTINRDDLIFYLQTPEQLNRVLVFIKSVCKIEKYLKSGIEHYISVMAYTPEETPNSATDEALKLLNLGCTNKMICPEIVSECLKTVSDGNFIAMAIGNYEDIPDSLYELVEKNSY